MIEYNPIISHVILSLIFCNFSILQKLINHLQIFLSYLSRNSDFSIFQGLVLISLFLKGQMPWSDSKSDKECRERKSACDITALSAENNCPEVTKINSDNTSKFVCNKQMTTLRKLIYLLPEESYSFTFFIFSIITTFESVFLIDHSYFYNFFLREK